MEQDKKSKNDYFFEDIIKKTKTGITFPKQLREDLFRENEEIYFRMVIPKEKNKIILEILSEEQAKLFSDKIKAEKSKISRMHQKKTPKVEKERLRLTPNWGDYFVYDFEAKEKVKPILESAFYKFAEKPVNLEDAMGRVKYTLISFLSSTKTENAKLYFSILKFLIDIIEKFALPNLIEWIYEKLIPNIESKFLYELALLELISCSINIKKLNKSELFIEKILDNIDNYPKSEFYNIMNSFKQLVNKVQNLQITSKSKILIKEKIVKYIRELSDDNYKIQLIELLENLKFIEVAYNLAKEIQMNLPPDSILLEEIRRLVRRLKEKPIE
ncbi:MAG: hypothetical protein ACFFAN_03130 [Promethearchaeota archaeon]